MANAELIVIRHGETDSPGTLNGRTDVALVVRPASVALKVDVVWTSPAIRASETAAGLFPDVNAKSDARLWEQDFGVWDGGAVTELPDLGEMSKAELASFRNPEGESFHDMLARVQPAIREAADLAIAENIRVAIVAHAGTVRAALAVAMETAAPALAFQVTHLGASRFRCFPGGLAVTAVNEVLL